MYFLLHVGHLLQLFIYLCLLTYDRFCLYISIFVCMCIIIIFIIMTIQHSTAFVLLFCWYCGPKNGNVCNHTYPFHLASQHPSHTHACTHRLALLVSNKHSFCLFLLSLAICIYTVSFQHYIYSVDTLM